MVVLLLAHAAANVVDEDSELGVVQLADLIKVDVASIEDERLEFSIWILGFKIGLDLLQFGSVTPMNDDIEAAMCKFVRESKSDA